MEATRFDFSEIAGYEKTDEGFLKVWCRAARTGVQTYHRNDGTVVREYRPPEEVAKPESLATFGMKPVTWGHPPVLLDSNNTKDFQIGHAGSQVRFNDGFVEVALLVTDNDKIDKILRRDAVEVSAGYRVDADPTPGTTPEGEPYDVVQRKIRVNHIAVVPKGRAGSNVRLLLDKFDSDDTAVAFEQAQTSPAPAPYMASIHLDGMTLDLASEVAGPITAYINKLRADADTAKSTAEELKTKLDEAEAALSEAQEAVETANGRADALEEELQNLENGEDRTDGAGDGPIDLTRIDTAQLDTLLKMRLDTLEHLAPAFDEDFVADGIGEDELYVQAFTNLFGEAPAEEADPGYIRGLVDGALLQFNEDSADDAPRGRSDAADAAHNTNKSTSTTPLINALKGVKRSDAREATTRYHNNVKSGWQRPMAASRTSRAA